MTKKNDFTPSSKTAAQQRASMKTGKKPKSSATAPADREAVFLSGRPTAGGGHPLDHPQPVSRGRLLARVTGAVTTGVQLMPHTENLHSGLLLAALVLLGLDVLIDFSLSALDASGRLWRVLRSVRASTRRDADGAVVATVRVGAPWSARRGSRLRITGRLVSSLLIVGSTTMEKWHHELLVAALTTLLIDVISESLTLLAGYLRTRQD